MRNADVASRLKKRVALITPSFEGGGAERVMVNLANGLAAIGVQVDLVALLAAGPYRDQVSSQVRIVDLRARRMIAAMPALVRYLRSERPEAILSALDYINVATICANFLTGSLARVVVTTHKYFSVATQRSDLWRERWLLPLAMRFWYPRANAVVAISEVMADDLAKTITFPREMISVIYNPAVTPQMLERANEAPAHHWLTQDGPPVIIGVGRLHEQKNFLMLLEAFAILRAKRCARLIVFGEGPERAQLDAKVSELGIRADVDLPGFVQNPYAIMRHSALFVMSSRYEGLPTVLIEAMACGCPVVSTNCPSGPSEILDGGKFGPLVAVGDAGALAEAMIETLDNPLPSALLKARASMFHVDNVLEDYRRILFQPKDHTSLS